MALSPKKGVRMKIVLTKKMLMFASLVLGCFAKAGGMTQIPVQLLTIDNQGRIEFINRALSETGLANDATARYEDIQSIIVGGDEDGSDFKGALMIYSVKLDSSKNGFQRFECSQFLSVGNFNQQFTRPMECKKLPQN